MTELETLAQNAITRLAPDDTDAYLIILDTITAAYALGRAAATSAKRRAASKANGASPVKLGSRPRGRPRKNETQALEMKP